MRKLILIGLVFFLSGAVFSQENPTQIFKEANQAYDQKDYSGAIKGYRSLLEKGITSPAIYYNLGNAYFRQGNLGQAIWCFRKAQKLDPRDQDLKDNLDFARLYQIDKIKGTREFFLLSALSLLPNAFGLELTSWLAALLWWLLLLSLLLFLVYRNRSQVVRILLYASLMFFLILGISLWSGIAAQRKDSAVVLAGQADAKSGPGEDYVSLFTVHQGLECEIEEQKEDWYLIYLPNNSKGWVPVKALGII